jgi:hypothetical protein
MPDLPIGAGASTIALDAPQGDDVATTCLPIRSSSLNSVSLRSSGQKTMHHFGPARVCKNTKLWYVNFKYSCMLVMCAICLWRIGHAVTYQRCMGMFQVFKLFDAKTARQIR